MRSVRHMDIMGLSIGACDNCNSLLKSKHGSVTLQVSARGHEDMHT